MARASHTGNAALALERPSPRAYVFGFALMVLLPTVLALVLGFADPSASAWLEHWVGAGPWVSRVAGAAMLFLFTGFLFGGIVLLLRRHRVQLDAGGLEIATTFYRRRLAWADLRVDEARIVASDERPELRPAFKSNGVALPGFRSGWFRSRTFNRLFVATAGGPKLVWIPTRLGYDVLLQPRQPLALLEAIKAAAAPAMARGRPGR